MRILIDTNVILDVLLKRSSFYETAIEVLKLSARDDIQEFVSASAITDIYYIAYKNLRDKAAVRELLKKLLLNLEKQEGSAHLLLSVIKSVSKSALCFFKKLSRFPYLHFC